RRSYDQHGDFEDPDHPKALLEQRRSARAQRQLARFLALAPVAETYYAELAARRFNPRHHVNKIVALSEIYGSEAVARALEAAAPRATRSTTPWPDAKSTAERPSPAR